MHVSNYLYPILQWDFVIHIVILFFQVFLLKKHAHSSTYTSHDDSWTWKESLGLFYLLISYGIVIFFIVKLSSDDNSVLKACISWIFAASVVLQFMSQIIPSSQVIGHIVSGNSTGKLRFKDRSAVTFFGALLLAMHAFQTEERVQTAIQLCNSIILRDFFLALLKITIISSYAFLICALSVNPLQFLIHFLKRLFKHFPWTAFFQLHSKMNERLSGNYPSSTITASIIELFKTHSFFIRFIMCFLILPSTLIDIIHYIIDIFFDCLISIIYYSICILHQVIRVFTKSGEKILQWSDKKIVAFSFRLSVIFGLVGVVTLNRYIPIFSYVEESTAVLDFISSSIVIPIILEWIISFKQHYAQREQN